MATMTVGQLAKHIGVSADTVRFWEKSGLVPAPARSPNGYRLYSDDAVDRMRFIRSCQRVGLKLADIGQLLEVRDTGLCPCEPADDLVRRRLQEVSTEIERLRALQRQMSHLLVSVTADSCPEELPADWCPPATPQSV